MGLTSREDLCIAELVFYVPALFISFWVIKKHGLGRQLGWIYLALLAILRIVGASTGIAAVQNPSQGLIEASLICFGIGLSPLLLALLGILKRVNEGMRGQGIRPRFIQIVNIPILVGLILGVISGTKVYDSNPSTRNSGYDYMKTAVILYIVAFAALAAMSVITLLKKRLVLDGEQRLLFAALASLPFIAVRLLYSVITAFDRHSSVFSSISNSTTAVIVQSIMSVLMEFIVVAIYLATGLFVRVIPRSMVKEGYIDPPSYKASGTPLPKYAGTQSRGASSSYPPNDMVA